MKQPFRAIDPDWAWQPYEVDASHPWNHQLVTHLYRRAGFAVGWRDLQKAERMTPAEVVHQLISPGSQAAAFNSQMRRMARTVLANGEPHRLAAWWLYRMMHTPDQLAEKMILFWHGHFATSAAKVEDAALMYDQHEVLRRNGLGDFGQMTLQIAQDPAMLIYLDSATNRKAHPNENFARELMELFCMGEGRYSEQDIRELARCFTGWEIKRKRFRFNRYQHDFGSKSILDQTGEFSGEDGVRVVLEQKSTPRFIAAKLVRFFVMDEPWPDPVLIEPLAEQFERDGLRLKPLVERILGSRLFFSEHALGRKIKSPVEVAMGLLRALQATTDTTALERRLVALGQGLFYPPNVKGWDGGRTWINSSTLLGRTNLVRSVVSDDATRYDGGSLSDFFEKHGIGSAEETVDWLIKMLMAVPPPEDVRRRLVPVAEARHDDRSKTIADVISAMSTLPEFQLA